MKLEIVFAGVGGQGVVVASDIFCEAALLDGFDVAKAEVHGMAQRGGSIIAHVKIGDEVTSPLIEIGNADIVLGFEVLETARAMPFLKDKGTVVMNTKYIPPTVLPGLVNLPKNSDLVKIIRGKALNVYEIDVESLALKAGNSLVANTILLGALSVIPENPVRKASLEEAILKRLKPKYAQVNLKALQLGRECVSSNK